MQRPKSTHSAFLWLTKSEAAAFLGVTDRQIQRREHQGYIEKRIEARLPSQSKGRVLYSRADLEALKAGTPNVHAREVTRIDTAQPASSHAEVEADRGFLPLQTFREAGRGASTALVRAPGPGGADFFAALETAVRRGIADAVPRPWLTLREAVACSGLPRAFLLLRAREGVPWAIDVSRGGARQLWRFNREGLGGI